MTQKELEDKLNELHDEMDAAVEYLNGKATAAQQKVFRAITDMINRFETEDGRFVITQDWEARIIALQRQMESILGKVFIPSVKEYLTTYATVEKTNIALQKSFNDLEVEKELLSPLKQSIYKEAEYYLTAGLADAYVSPAKYLLMQHVTTGIGVRDSLKIFEKWNKGEGSNGIVKVPRLQSYATQLARDSLYQYHGAINDTISQNYGLTYFVYTGNVIEDSRPLCVHLVGLDRRISLDELPPILKKYPQGQYPGTNQENFLRYRGGYNCRHGAFAVRPPLKK